MARDAIARQYDVDKNAVILTCEDGNKGYRPGTIVFQAKKGKSIDLAKLHESLTATRLSGGTSMGVTYLELTITGEVTVEGGQTLLKAAGAGPQFVLGEDSGPLKRLREAVARGEKIVSVTGRVQGWNGRFPDVLRAVAKDKTIVLNVTDFQTAAK